MHRVFRLLVLPLFAAMPPSGSIAAQQSAHVAVTAGSAAGGADVLRPGDVVRLRIWREPDLSGDFMIDEHGIVTLPRVGPVRAIDQTVDSLKSRLLRAYRVYVSQPSIEVTPLRRVQVTGAVRTPGLYTVDPTMTIADAIALAGGVTPAGRRDRVVLVRGTQSFDARLIPRTGDARSPLRSGDELFVPERSWLSRNPGVVIAAISAIASLIWATRR